jgi:predicted RNase H-like HicB family nuclease
MPRESKTRIIRQATLPIVVRRRMDGMFVAEFDALRLTAEGMTYDGAVLNIARAIQTVLEAHNVVA